MLAAALAIGATASLAQDAPSPLVKTRWDQKGAYAAFVPEDDPDRLGCWSVALAQIAAFHGASPRGEAKYVTRAKRLAVAEDFSRHAFDVARFPARLGASTDPALREQVARYAYFAAVVLQKDFGTTRYQLRGEKKLEAIERHYPLKVSATGSMLGHDRERAWSVIVDEVRGARPMLYYMESRDKKTFHAVVLDGAREAGAKREAHLNFGWSGQGDGWYDFFQPIVTPSGKFRFDDVDYFYLLAFRPAS